MSAVLAVDIGGTKLAAAVVDADGGIRRRGRVPTATDAPFDALAGLLRRLEQEAGADGLPIVGVGVGCGGPMRWPEGVVSTLNIPSWREFPLRDRLVELFPGVPVRLHNDAITFAAGEHWRGAGVGAANLLGMVVSTGVGGGLILDGVVRDGPTGNAGHLGHVVVEPDGPPCTCGGRGCLEAIARGPATVAWARERGFPGTDGAALARAARDDDPVALAAFTRSGAAVGVALAGAAALLDLDMAVVGGGLSAAGELLFAPMREAFAAHAAMPFVARMRILPAARPDDAGLLGAAALVLEGERYWSVD
jgi:glucokinase